jgi:hypothetical protein
MIRENNLATVRRFDNNAYTSCQTKELALNGAILRAEIARSYEEFLDIFERFAPTRTVFGIRRSCELDGCQHLAY